MFQSFGRQSTINAATHHGADEGVPPVPTASSSGSGVSSQDDIMDRPKKGNHGSSPTKSRFFDNKNYNKNKKGGSQKKKNGSPTKKGSYDLEAQQKQPGPARVVGSARKKETRAGGSNSRWKMTTGGTGAGPNQAPAVTTQRPAAAATTTAPPHQYQSFNSTYNATLSQIEQEFGVTSFEQHGHGTGTDTINSKEDEGGSIYSPTYTGAGGGAYGGNSHYFHINLDPEGDDPSVSTLGDESLLRHGVASRLTPAMQQQQILLASHASTLDKMERHHHGHGGGRAGDEKSNGVRLLTPASSFLEPKVLPSSAAKAATPAAPPGQNYLNMKILGQHIGDDDDISTLGDESLLRTKTPVGQQYLSNARQLEDATRPPTPTSFLGPDMSDLNRVAAITNKDSTATSTSATDASLERNDVPPPPPPPLPQSAPPFLALTSPTELREICIDNKRRTGKTLYSTSGLDGAFDSCSGLISPTSDLDTPSVVQDPPSLSRGRAGTVDEKSVYTSQGGGGNSSIVFPFDERTMGTVEPPVKDNKKDEYFDDDHEHILKRHKWTIIYFIFGLSVFLLLVAGGALTYSLLHVNRTEVDDAAAVGSSSNLNAGNNNGGLEQQQPPNDNGVVVVSARTVTPTSSPTGMPSKSPVVPTAAPTGLIVPSPTLAVAPMPVPTSPPKASVSPTSSPLLPDGSSFFDPITIDVEASNATDAINDVVDDDATNSTESFQLTPDELMKVDDLLTGIARASPESLDAVGDAESPQYQAFDWLVRDPNYWNYQADIVIQRWALAVFYFSTNGPAWNTVDFPSNFPGRTAWLSYSDECLWASTNEGNEGSICDSRGRIRALHLLRVGLEGIIPSEFGLLSDGLEVLFLGGNDLTGTLPTILGRLTGLKKMQASYNDFEGTLPTELGNLSLLTIMSLGNNRIEGTIPTELGNLGALLTLSLSQNQLNGSLPEELAGMTSIDKISIEHNFLTGEIPGSFRELETTLTNFSLHRNSFSGEMPKPLCPDERRSAMVTLRADCEEIECDCCTECFEDPDDDDSR